MLSPRLISFSRYKALTLIHLNQHTSCATAALLAISLLVIGCQTQSKVDPEAVNTSISSQDTIDLASPRDRFADVTSPFTIKSELYEEIFAATTTVLHDFGFTIDRQDYRFGLISSEPQGAPTVIEVWKPANSTTDQVARATTNDLRRIVRVRISPIQTSNDQPASPSNRVSRYEVAIEVTIEKHQTPIRRMVSGSGLQTFQQLDELPPHLKQKGLADQYWIAVDRDPHLENRLAQAIADIALDSALFWSSDMIVSQ